MSAHKVIKFFLKKEISFSSHTFLLTSESRVKNIILNFSFRTNIYDNRAIVTVWFSNLQSRGGFLVAKLRTEQRFENVNKLCKVCAFHTFQSLILMQVLSLPWFQIQTKFYYFVYIFLYKPTLLVYNLNNKLCLLYNS